MGVGKRGLTAARMARGVPGPWATAAGDGDLHRSRDAAMRTPGREDANRGPLLLVARWVTFHAIHPACARARAGGLWDMLVERTECDGQHTRPDPG